MKSVGNKVNPKLSFVVLLHASQMWMILKNKEYGSRRRFIVLKPAYTLMQHVHVNG